MASEGRTSRHAAEDHHPPCPPSLLQWTLGTHSCPGTSMQTVAAILLLLAGANGCQAATPVDKVITLLTKLSKQVQEEGVAEAASYDKYACFCKDQADSKTYVIAKSDKKIEELEAAIEALQGEITALDEAVTEAQGKVEEEEKTQEEKKKARGKEQEEYAKERKSLVEAVHAVERALESMRNSRDDVDKTVSSLLQKLPANSPALALIAGATAGKRFGQPKGEAKAYQYRSKEVIATLVSLTATFKKELQELDETEMSALSDYEMAAGARANTIKALNKEITEKQTLSAAKSEDKADKEGQKDLETTDRNADQAFLDELTSKCEAKAKAWDQRSTARAAELTALAQATELLKGMGDTYNTNTKLVGLVSKKSHATIVPHKPATFIQLRSARRQNDSQIKLQEVISRVNKAAKSLNSASLAMLALRLQTNGDDHFVKVRGIIKDLIAKLEADAAAEATAKTECDNDMAAAVKNRDAMAAKYETAGANIDATESDIAGLKEDIAGKSKEIAEMNKQLLELEELRANDKAQNAKSIEDATKGKEAVDSAIAILNEFYGTSLVQQTPTDRSGKSVGDMAPETFSSDEEYKGKTEGSKGIIGMLEVISSDFERTLTTVQAAEEEGEADYKEFKKDEEQSIKDREKSKAADEQKVEDLESDLTQYKDDKKTAQLMNEQAIEELEKLSASCVDNGESYAERKKHRQEEIEALKQAMQILEDWK